MTRQTRDVPARLNGQVALVTGAARRVGRSIAHALAEDGADVAVHYRRSGGEADAVCRELGEMGVRAESVSADLADAQAASELAARVVGSMGRLDVCVLNASIFYRTPLADVTAEIWDEFQSVNLRSVFLVAQAAGQIMQANDTGGSIVTIGDWAGMRPYDDYLPYCVSKAGVIAMTKGLVRSLAPKVRINCVCPGPVLLPEDLGEAERREVLQNVPLQRIGHPQDIAEAVRFLVCGTDFATGTILNVDGGRLAG